MATVIRYTGHPDGYLDFYMGDEIIVAQNSIDVITAQQLWNALLDVEDEQLAVSFLGIGNAEGKTQSIQSPLTVTLLRNWRINKEGVGSLTVQDGNVVSETFGVNIFVTNPDVNFINFLATGEKSQISNAEIQAIADAVWNKEICP